MTSADLNKADPVLASRTWAKLRDIVLVDDDPRKQVADALGITYFKIKILLRLFDGPTTASELVYQFASDKTYISLILRDLELDGSIERIPSDGDRRTKVVSLTATGRRQAEQAQRILDRPPVSFEKLTPNDLQALLDLLSKLRPDLKDPER